MKIKIYELINKIANREEMPKEVIYMGKKYKWCRDIGDYRINGWAECLIISIFTFDNSKHNSLYNMIFDEVEIIEEEKMVSIPESEYLKWLDFKSIANQPCEEEKKIPEKLKKKKIINGSFEGKTTYIYKYNEYEIGEAINEIIDYLDYLESKGE